MADLDAAEDDLYALLGFSADDIDVLALRERELASAYRKQALRWHPDKNTAGDEHAAAMLARVFVAYEILSNPKARTVYDDKLRALAARNLERAKLNEGRRRLRDDLVRRERAAADAAQLASEHNASRQHAMPADLESRLRREIERLRMEHGLRREVTPEHVKTEQPETGPSGIESTPWAAIPGFAQWHAADINFFDLEAAILARARGTLSSSASGEDGTGAGNDSDGC
jgi:curved DNA-binding protein CbpA